MAKSPVSSANFLSYDIRPAKQTERLLILDVLRMAGDIGLPISDYRYVGMGANRFYDFLMMHRYIGISKMISLEHDPVMFKRAEFNCPFKFIQMSPSSSGEFIDEDDFNFRGVYWFDYDGGLSKDIIEDISTISSKLEAGDFLFVTVFGGCMKYLESLSDKQRFEWIKDNFSNFAGAVTMDDAQKSKFGMAIYKIVLSAFQNAFAYHPSGDFSPFFRLRYKDSVPMMTLGGGLFSKSMGQQLIARLANALPFLKPTGADMYSLKTPHLTEKERAVFDLVTTNSRKVSKEKNKLMNIGFSEKDITAYQEIIRYYPRYVETLL